MYNGLRARLAPLAAEAVTAHPGAFWLDRVDTDGESSADDADLTVLRSDPDVLKALEELKRRPAIRLRETPALGRTQRAVVRGNNIVVEEHLTVPSFANGIRYIRSVDLVTIVALTPLHDQVPDLFDAYNHRAPPTPLPDFLGALSVLIGKGVLEFA